MPASQSDTILRMIEQLGAAMRRLRERLARGVPAAPEVLEEAEHAQAELFGPLWPTLRAVDAATGVALIGDEHRVRLWVEMLRLEADAADLLGADVRAGRLRERADSVMAALADRTSSG